MHSLNILLETQKNSTVYIKNNVQNLAGVKGLIKGLKVSGIEKNNSFGTSSECNSQGFEGTDASVLPF